MRFRVIGKRVAFAAAAVVGGASLGVWALPKLQNDEVLFSFIIFIYVINIMKYREITFL